VLLIAALRRRFCRAPLIIGKRRRNINEGTPAAETSRAGLILRGPGLRAATTPDIRHASRLDHDGARSLLCSGQIDRRWMGIKGRNCEQSARLYSARGCWSLNKAIDSSHE